MAWYTILFITTATLFVVKLVISWFAGDIDLDVDFDGNSDFDTSSAFSFKGLLHFLLGSSAYLFLRSLTDDVVKIDNVAQFTISDYAWAIAIGIMLMLILYSGYKVAMKANQKPLSPEDLINGSTGTIYLNLGNGQYSVEVHTKAGTINVTAFYSTDELEPGTVVNLIKEGSNIEINDVR